MLFLEQRGAAVMGSVSISNPAAEMQSAHSEKPVYCDESMCSLVSVCVCLCVCMYVFLFVFRFVLLMRMCEFVDHLSVCFDGLT